jgi:hypothetical protein
MLTVYKSRRDLSLAFYLTTCPVFCKCELGVEIFVHLLSTNTGLEPERLIFVVFSPLNRFENWFFMPFLFVTLCFLADAVNGVELKNLGVITLARLMVIMVVRGIMSCLALY